MNRPTDQTVSEAMADAHYAIPGPVLKVIRQQSGLTQKTLAGLIGVSQPTWANWERGVHRPSLRHRGRIRRVLNDIRIELSRLDSDAL